MRSNELAPARRFSFNTVTTSPPSNPRTEAVTRAALPSVNETLAVPVASGSGPTTAGVTASFERVGATGAGGGGLIVPNAPLAGRTSGPAAIVQANGPF